MPPKAVSKDALLIILDCGPDSFLNPTKEGETFFSRAKNCVIRIFEQKMFGCSNDEIGLLLMGAPADNCLYTTNPDRYKHLAQVLDLKLAMWDSARFIDQNVQACDEQADWFEALRLAIRILREKGESRTYGMMKIVLLTTFASTVGDVSEKRKQKVMNELKKGTSDDQVDQGPIELIVINENIEYDQDFEREDPHFSQTPQKSQQQQITEELITEIVKETNGVLCNLENAELQLLYFEKKKVKGRPNAYSFKIGSKITIEVAEYLRVTEPKFLKPWRNMYSTGADVTKATKYFQNDEEIKVTETGLNNANNLNTSRNDSVTPMEVDEAEVVEVIKGYMYGSTAVPFDASFKPNYGEKSLMCIGFSDQKYVFSEYLSGKGCHVVVPSFKYTSSPQKFAALVKALHEMNFVVIARKVYNKSSSPKTVALFPEYTEDQKPYLTMIALHFREDCIDIKFPSLRNAKRFQPTQEQYDVMDRLINDMDLMTAGNEKSGNAEAFSLNKTLNIVHQHTCRVIAHRALHPHEPVQQISEELKALIDVPKKIKDMSRDTLLRAKELFVLEEVKKPSKIQLLEERLKKITEKAADNSSNASDLNVSVNTQTHHVGTVTPAEDFLFLVDKGVLDFDTAARQLQEVIHKITFQAFSVTHTKLLKAIMAYRDMASEMRPKHYNDWIVTFKEELLSKEKQNLFTQLIVDESLGLITSTESNLSIVAPEKAEEFYRTNDVTPVTITTAPPTNEEDFESFIE